MYGEVYVVVCTGHWERMPGAYFVMRCKVSAFLRIILAKSGKKARRYEHVVTVRRLGLCAAC